MLKVCQNDAVYKNMNTSCLPADFHIDSPKGDICISEMGRLAMETQVCPTYVWVWTLW